jgi:hypothetical protein
MSAREKLLEVLRGDADECYCYSVNCTPVETLVDDFAHELAEKIRDAGEAQVGWGQAMRQAADLIDPQRHCQAWCGCLCHDADPSPCDDCTVL